MGKTLTDIRNDRKEQAKKQDANAQEDTSLVKSPENPECSNLLENKKDEPKVSN